MEDLVGQDYDEYYNSKEWRSVNIDETEDGLEYNIRHINFDVEEPIVILSEKDKKYYKIDELERMLDSGNLNRVCAFLRYRIFAEDWKATEKTLILNFFKVNNVLEEARVILDSKSDKGCFLYELIQDGRISKSIKYLFCSGMYTNDNVTHDKAVKMTSLACRFSYGPVASYFIDQCTLEEIEGAQPDFCFLFGVIRRCRSIELFKKFAKLKKGDMRCSNFWCRKCRHILTATKFDTQMKINRLVPAAREYTRNLLSMKFFVRQRRREEIFLSDEILLKIFKYAVDETETFLPSFLSILNKS